MPTAGANEHLFEFGRYLARLDKLAAEAQRRLDVTSDTCERMTPAEMPRALFVRPADCLALRSRPELLDGKPTGRHYYDADDIEKAGAAFIDIEKDEAAHIAGAALSDDARSRREAQLARLREIIESDQSHRDAIRSAWGATGMDAAADDLATAVNRCMEMRRQIAGARRRRWMA